MIAHVCVVSYVAVSFQSLGITKEDAAKDQESLSVDYADPDGFDLTLENLAKLRPDIDSKVLEALQKQRVFGPPVALLAGFRIEELAIVRVLLDSAGGQVVKVIPVSSEMMTLPVRDVVDLPEPEWDKPRPEDFPLYVHSFIWLYTC